MLSGAPETQRKRRSYAADDVFEAVASEILRGELEPGSILPPERALSERFDVSKLLVRQAIHRLAEARLVRVRQGDVTRVLDPASACDLRVIELYYRMAPSSRGAHDLAAHVLEKQYTQGLSLLDTFVRRASQEAREALVAIMRAREEAIADEASFAAFEREVWTHIASAGGNRILEAEVGWWYEVLPSRPTHPKVPPRSARYAFYVELAKRSARDESDAVGFYRSALAPAMTALFAAHEASTAKRQRSNKKKRPR